MGRARKHESTRTNRHAGKQPVRRGRSFWREAVREWQAGGLSRADYCARAGLKPSTLTWWKWKLTAEGDLSPAVAGTDSLAREEPTPSAAFLPVRVVASASGSELHPGGEAAIEVVLRGGRRVLLREGWRDEQQLRRLILLLEDLSC